MPPHPNLKEWTVPVPNRCTARQVAEDEVRKRMHTGDEHFVVYEPPGTTVYVATSKSSVGCAFGGGATEAAMRKFSGTFECGHNHPSSSPFSASDYPTPVEYPNLSEMWVLGHDNVSQFSLQPTVRDDLYGVAAGAWEFALALVTKKQIFDPNTGDLTREQDFARRHGICLGLHAAQVANYHYTMPQQHIYSNEFALVCRRVKVYVQGYCKVATAQRARGANVDYVLIDTCLHSLLL